MAITQTKSISNHINFSRFWIIFESDYLWSIQKITKIQDIIKFIY